ncbi:GerAB/ArcD/ProY family transporter [Acetanaerobacterium elongatum]|uniref:Spore germination protein KB n=1 Tax=Acetanaerobacterium elongatum TaxID=258515 RepID=A0A1G9XU45_9FIRM|nr:endospore germination permease [Acetanaerobacterium elongatum]SDM99695.1 spore germination protein KB [Acetanaerobacterium elongatum]
MNTAAKDQISSRDLLFSAAAYVQASSLLTAFITGTLRQSSWVGTVAAYALALILLAILLFLFKRHPGMGLVQLNDAVFGKVAGRIVSFCYFFFIFTLVSLNIGDLNGFLNSYILSDTPPIAIVVPLMLVCVIAVRKGIDSVFRLGPLFSALQIITLILFTVMLIPNMKPANMLPVLDLTPKEFWQGTNTLYSLPFGDLFIVILAIPAVSNIKNYKSIIFKGFTIGAVITLLIVITDTLVLGPLLSNITLPRFLSIRLINVADVFTRMDIVYAYVLIVLRYFKLCVLLYVCSLLLAQIFELKSYVPLVSTLGILTAIYSLFLFRSGSESSEWAANTAGIYGTFFNTLLPLLTFIVYLIQLLLKKLKAKTS